jgi:hypothetical protein
LGFREPATKPLPTPEQNSDLDYNSELITIYNLNEERFRCEVYQPPIATGWHEYDSEVYKVNREYWKEQNRELDPKSWRRLESR